MKTLHVTEVDVNTLKRHGWPVWQFKIADQLRGIYIRCNKKGEVNWKVAPVYTTHELIERNNVKIVK